jgi:hypothetical protein
MTTQINLFTNYIFFLIYLILSIVLLLVSFFVSINLKNSEKISAYGCEFGPFKYK